MTLPLGVLAMCVNNVLADVSETVQILRFASRAYLPGPVDQPSSPVIAYVSAGESLDDQLRRLRSVLSQAWPSVEPKFVVDAVEPDSSSRRGFRKLIHDVARQQVKVVAVTGLERIVTTEEELAELLICFQHFRVGLWSIEDAEQLQDEGIDLIPYLQAQIAYPQNRTVGRAESRLRHFLNIRNPYCGAFPRLTWKLR